MIITKKEDSMSSFLKWWALGNNIRTFLMDTDNALEFERLLNRPLSQVEFSRIREWISYGYSDETIINALKETLSKGL